MDRAEKVAEVEALKGVFSEAGVVLITHYIGMSVADMTTLRGRLREADAQLKVVKNRLVKLAIQDAGAAENASELFTGPTAIAWASDAVAASKAAVAYAKENDKFVLRGAVFGETILDKEGVEALAKMPPLDEMRAKLLGTLNAPASKLARTLNAPGSQLATVLKAHQDKLEEAA